MIAQDAAGEVPDGLEVRLSSVGAAFGEEWLFRKVDLTLSPGDWVAILGPSGAGKTTLVRFLAGLLDPSEGEATVGGRSWASLRGPERTALRRRIGLVQQQTGLLHATALENVALPLRWRGMTDEEAARTARDCLSAVGLSASAPKNALTLSGGERQRLGFARAIAPNPDVLCLDEFTNNQDPAHGDVLESIVADRVERGASAVVVAHDLAQVDRIARAAGRPPTLGILIGGRWRALGRSDVSSFADPNDDVASFLQRLVGRSAAA